MSKYINAMSGVMAWVDCAGEGKPLCEKLGIRVYPVIKWGEPDAMVDYEGGTTFPELRDFCQNNLVVCHVRTHHGLCKEEHHKEFADLEALDADELDNKIHEAEQRV